MSVNVDFTRYATAKAAKTIQLQKVGTKAVVFVASFDPATGAELEPAIAPLNVVEVQRIKEGLEAQEKQIAAQIAGVDAFLADIAALGVVS